jgi:hypothetical protein
MCFGVFFLLYKDENRVGDKADSDGNRPNFNGVLWSLYLGRQKSYFDRDIVGQKEKNKDLVL